MKGTIGIQFTRIVEYLVGDNKIEVVRFTFEEPHKDIQLATVNGTN